MSSQIQSIKSELSRVRELKRNAESALKLIRQDNEKGVIHVRVNQDPKFKKEVAEAIVKEAHPGYHSQCWHYADPVEGKVYYRESQSAWNPWCEGLDWRIVQVGELVNQDNNDFSGAPNWKEFDRKAELLRDWIEAEGEELEPNGDIPEWAWSQLGEAIAWGFDSSKWASVLMEYEADQHQIAVDFALSEFKDEIVIDINSH